MPARSPGMAALCTRPVPRDRHQPCRRLERAAKLLDASKAGDGVGCRPGRARAAAGDGTRLPAEPRDAPGKRSPKDAENVTAAAFRTGLLQTVKADAISHGAIAAPLLTPVGPVGVMAAEVLNDGERREATRAAAAIVAAQLATLMGPPAARHQGKNRSRLIPRAPRRPRPDRRV